MRESDDLKQQFGRLLRTALSGAQDVADEVRRSAHRIRERLDSHPFEQEKRELFAKLGEETYELYKKGRVQVPQLLKESVQRLDQFTGDIIGQETIRRAGDMVDDVVRGVVDEINDFCEETIHSRRAENSSDASASDSSHREMDTASEGSPPPAAATAPKGQPTRSKSGETAKSGAKTKRNTSARTAQKKPAATGANRPKRGPVLASDPLANVVGKPEDNGN